MGTLTISEIGCSESKPYRVWADVAGSRIWFESEDFMLRPSLEAFGSALLMPALQQGLQMCILGDVDPVWAQNAKALTEIFRGWWGHTAPPPSLRSGTSLERPASTATGLCFTGGVDSFHALLRGTSQTDYLVYIHGYDIQCTDREGMIRFRRSLDEIAQIRIQP